MSGYREEAPAPSETSPKLSPEEQREVDRGLAWIQGRARGKAVRRVFAWWQDFLRLTLAIIAFIVAALCAFFVEACVLGIVGLLVPLWGFALIGALVPGGLAARFVYHKLERNWVVED